MSNKIKNIAVLGAGNGGQAVAAYLALQGFKVNLYNRSKSRLLAVKKEGGIHLSGVYQGFAQLNKVTSNIQEAILNTELIMVVTAACGHKYLAQAISPYLKSHQIIVLNPGRTGGALEFYKTLQDQHCLVNPIIAEAQSFIYATRLIAPAQARIFGVKKRVAIAAFPSIRTRELIEVLIPIFPQFYPVENVLKTSVDNIGAIFHPVPTLLNVARIEANSEDFPYYQQGITPTVSKILEEIDQERMNIGFALKIEPTSVNDWLRLAYGVQGKDLYELLQNNEKYQGITAPSQLEHRYVLEDIPMSLVPLSSLAKMLGIKTPTIDMFIKLANLIYDTDFYQQGRTVESLGLTGLNINEIQEIVTQGKLRKVKFLSQLKKNIYPKIDPLIFEQEKVYQKEVE